jgi:hypothetical protein
MRYAAFRERKARKFLLDVNVLPHGGDIHFHGPVERILVETGGLINNAADDYMVNAMATTPRPLWTPR